MRKIIFLIAIIQIFLAIPVVASDEAKSHATEFSPNYSAGSVLVMDAETGVVLYETQGFTRRYPASITKIMTALVVLEEVQDLYERVIFSENAVTLPHYAGRMHMEAGESITVLEALYGIMLPSANDIARALAEHVSGNIPDFVEKMNHRAWELGAYNTRFINPCGLPGANQFTTAYDIALIKNAATAHPLYVEIIGTPYFYLPPTNMHEYERQMRNSNLMVRPSRGEFNSYVIGGKTGFTNAAQHTLVTYAANDFHEVIISVLYASPRGTIFSDTAALIEFIFRELPEPVIYEVTPPPNPHETVQAFAEAAFEIAELVYIPAPEYVPLAQAVFVEISTSQAVASASLSAALAAAALIGLAFVRKKYYN
jgi:D-alanyl-D-alanine carboxypeptidase